MPRSYKAQWRYSSSLGTLEEGQVSEMSEEEAAAYNRDSPGVLVPIDSSPEVEGRAMSGPPQDRQFRGEETRAPEEDVEESNVDATEAARELAEEHGIDLASVKGSGVDGRVLVGDVEALID